MMPFTVLGVFMIITVPINLYVLPTQDGEFLRNLKKYKINTIYFKTHFNIFPSVLLDGCGNAGSSQLSYLVRIVPIVVVLCSVVVGSIIWAILDPTLEPHLREVS